MTDQIIDEPCLKPPDRIRTPGRQDESKLGSLLCQEMEERCGRFELPYCLTVHPDGAVQARHGKAKTADKRNALKSSRRMSWSDGI
jgi:hypothetical protein